MTSEARTLPWSLSDARTVFLTTSAATGMLVWAWWECSGTAKLSAQATWMTVGVIAVVVLTLGNAFWVMSARRAVRIRRDELLIRTESIGALAREDTAERDLTRPVVILGTWRYHRHDCCLVEGKHVVWLDSTPAGERDLRPCEMCRP